MQRRISLSGESLGPALASLTHGVGLLRSEFVLRYFGASFQSDKGRDAIHQYVAEIASKTSPRPVWYRLADLWSDEANPLSGSIPIPHEANPLVGLRGVRPALIDPTRLESELRILTKLAHTHVNLHILVPFVADGDQFKAVVELLREAHWPNRFGAMVEIPAAVVGVESFIEAGATNLLVGMNDLTSLMLGADRSSAFYSRNHPALRWAIRQVCLAARGRAEWGLGGLLDRDLIAFAATEGADYVTVAYAQAQELFGWPADLFPEADHVAEVRRRTRQRRAEIP